MNNFEIILIVIMCIVVFSYCIYTFNHYYKHNIKKNKLYNSLSKVKNGQKIKVNISGFVNDAICLNNSPSDKKMFVRKIFDSGRVSDTVYEYDDYTFINFNALNVIDTETPNAPPKESGVGQSIN